MKIALIGYGKMGREIEKSAISRGHEIVSRISSADKLSTFTDIKKTADVAIEFTGPDAAVNNIYNCFDADLPVVIGTTGWYDKLNEIRQYCLTNGKSMVYASNFSLGVNIFFEINRHLAGIMNQFPQYDVSIEESHHIKKLDAPSGTALSLATILLEEIDRKKNWQLKNSDANETDKTLLSVHSERIGEVPGTHIIKYSSLNDTIELKHEAINRSGFAEGAVIAAEWIAGKKGCFTMSDILDFKS